MQPFETMRFRHSWRPYQERVLNAIKEHLNDERLHVVAAPGAGKTTLGLEVFRVLEKTTLVLSPTRVIRDQWIERLKDFTGTGDETKLNWVSNSIHDPKVLTSITFQALHAKFAEELNADEDEGVLLEEDDGLKDNEVNSFIKVIEEHKIQILILDEAHHLRAEWWRALEKVCEYFPDIILVSLTATPPYDAQGHEWARYEQLCGPIDEEISVPELVKAGTLCAHQDFIWACNATANEKNQIKEYDDRVSTLCHTLFNSDDFKGVVLSHPWLAPDEIEADIIKEPQIAIALLVFIKAKSLPSNEELMALLDMKDEDIPELGRHWWQILIQTILFSKTTQHSDSDQQFIEQLKKQLRTSELLNKRELSLERSRRMERSLSLSTSKILACVTIHQLEYKHRGESLRQVILTDYIRDEALLSELDTGEINLGAWPIFKGLTSSSTIADQIGLLTGRICVIPTCKLQLLLNHIDSNNVKTESMGSKEQYQKVTAPLNQLTSAFTELLMNGDIKVLVGTRSLLGEGWDAPAINSLILASSVGSFMLTNQMRGRAIRIDPKNRDKISTIWHLVAINAKSYAGWSDYHNLKKRFETFVGLSEKELTIESGFERMQATSIESSYMLNETAPIAGNNRQMLRRYRKLGQISERWNDALTLDETARVIPSVKTNKTPKLRGLLLKHSFIYLFIQVVALLSGVMTSIAYLTPRSSSQLLLVLLAGIAGVLIYKLPKTISIIKTVFLYLPIDGALKQIGKALAEALCQAGYIETSIRQMKVNVTNLQDGTFYLSLSGCTFYESSVFADCLAEILAPIENPRYLILREGEFLGTSRDDYHAVPMKFAAKKERAQIFYNSWQKNVSLSELIYTRTEEGRRRLLKAKMKSFSSIFKDKVKRQDRWQ
ncbi:DEAD/DEAH box helicase family protein [Shewanella woodyi]|uniref:DEAD/DEAH box helicase family protein n=1 Tax=Shewanella woodyi TaxID=60961 RepID=UPI000AB334CE|nr:DEAD/DEAH box helicase family protein [Shewanella woodyi]